MVAVTHRVRQHFVPDEPTAGERQRFVAEAVARAMTAVVGLLDHDDPKVVLKAAGMLLDLEKTRLRHGRAVLEPMPPPVVEPQAAAEPQPEVESEIDPEEEPFPTPETHPELFHIRDEPWTHDGLPVGPNWKRPCFIPRIPPEEEWDKLPRGRPTPDFTRAPDDP